MGWAIVIGLTAAVFGPIGAWVGVYNRRRPAEGLVLGVLLGPIGVLVEALLPHGVRPARTLRRS